MKYLIIPTSRVPEVKFWEVRESGPFSLRYSVDNTKTFIKWVPGDNGSDTPHCVDEIIAGVGTYWGPYNKEDFTTIINGEEWVGIAT